MSTRKLFVLFFLFSHLCHSYMHMTYEWAQNLIGIRSLEKMPTASTLHWFGVLRKRDEEERERGKKYATLHKWKGFFLRWTKQISRLKCLCVCWRCAYVWKEKRQKVLRWLLQWMSDTIRYSHTFRWMLCMRNKKATNQFFHFSFWTIQLWMRSLTLWSSPYSRWCD